MLAQPSSVLGSFGPSDGGAEHDLSPLLSSERGHCQVELQSTYETPSVVVDCLLVFVSGSASFSVSQRQYRRIVQEHMYSPTVQPGSMYSFTVMPNM